MSDISIPGVKSKYNTDKTIEGLVKAERIPLDRMETDLKGFETKKKLWQDVKRRTKALETSAGKLFGFENPFQEKLVDSSNERILDATVTRNADLGEYDIKVIQTAKTDKFLSKSIEESYRVEKGLYTFKVGEEDFSLKYRGGRLKDFIRRVNEKGEGIVKLSLINDRSDSKILVVQSLKEGAKNGLFFENDAEKLALDLGLMRLSKGKGVTLSLKRDSVQGWDKSIPAKSFSITDDSLVLNPGAALSLPVSPEYEISEGTVLEYEVEITSLGKEYYEQQEAPDPSIPGAPEASFQDIIIDSEGSVLDLPEKPSGEPPERREDLGVVFINDGKKNISLSPLEDKEGSYRVEIRLGGKADKVRSINFRNNNTYRKISIKGIAIREPSQRGKYEPVNAIDTARDAILEFEGIEIIRETNTIDDLIPGVTLLPKRADKDEVSLEVKPNTELAKEGLIKFMDDYNYLMTAINVFTTSNPDVVDELDYLSDDQREDAMEHMGTLKGDTTLRQLKSRLQVILANSYPTKLKQDLSLLAQIGISTNASKGLGGGMDFTKLRGYLEVNEELLDQNLEENSIVIKELFGNDTDGDQRIDSGVAYELGRYLKPYVTNSNGGVLTSRLTRIDGQITRKKEDIDDYKEHLTDYERDLKRKYGKMEGMMNQLERTSKGLEGLNNTGGK